jgi:hypothetical protein
MNKVVVVRPACRAAARGSAGLPTGQRGKRRLQMHLASPTSPAHLAVSSDIMKKGFSASCWSLESGGFRPWVCPLIGFTKMLIRGRLSNLPDRSDMLEGPLLRCGDCFSEKP